MQTVDPKSLSADQRADLLVRRVAGFFAALLVGPGAGQLTLGHRWRAALWLVMGVLTVLPGPLVSVWAFYANLPLRVASGIDTLLLRPPKAGSPRWLTVVGLWAGLMAVSFGLRAATPRFYQVLNATEASMAPQIEQGEQILLVTRGFTPQRGDAVAIYDSAKKEIRLSRVLATEGDSVLVQPDGGVLVNGKRLTWHPRAGSCHYTVSPRVGDSKKPAPSKDAKRPSVTRRPCRAVNERQGVFVRTVLLPPSVPAPDPPAPGSQPTQLTAPPHADKSKVAMSSGQKGPATLSPPSASGHVTPLQVAQGKVFVWADNRALARDSQPPQMVPRDRVLGRVRAIWWSADQQGLRWSRIGQPIR